MPNGHAGCLASGRSAIGRSIDTRDERVLAGSLRDAAPGARPGTSSGGINEMSKLLEGKVAVVTGSGRGIGRGIALALAQEGASVVVNDVGCGTDGRGTDADPAAVVCKEIEALGSKAAPNYDSVAEFDSAGNIIKTAIDAFGRCDILVNNAGILRDKQLVNMAPEDFDAVLKVHLYGGFNCCRHALPVMRENGYGRIINIVSSAGLRGNFGQANYGAAKAGLMGLAFVIAVEHMKGNAEGKYSITANCLAPAGHDAHGGTDPGHGRSADPARDEPGPERPDGGVSGLGAGEARERAGLRSPRLRLHAVPDAEAARLHVQGGRPQRG